MAYTTILDVVTLSEHIGDPDWIVFDVRHDLGNLAAGELAYFAEHLPGAFFLHLDNDLSGEKTGTNGRHPLPLPHEFAQRVADFGVSPNSQVVVYDASGGAFAARFWWMMRWIGFEAVAVLDGGFQAWTNGVFPMERTLPHVPQRGTLEMRTPLVARVEVDQILSNLETRQKLVVDARSPDRFRGENETIDPVGGRIPGAINRFFKENLEADGRFKSSDLLRHEFLTLFGAMPVAKIVAQCGSGVTACHNLLAMELAGLSGGSLYAGSWSEWCSDPSRPVELG